MLLIKLLITPLFIGLTTVAGRRWGARVSGILIGLPLTSGPVSVFLTIQYGADFAQHAIVGNLAGLMSVSIFCIVYALISKHARWPACVIVASVSFLAVTAVWNVFDWTLSGALLGFLIVVIIATRLIPEARTATSTINPPAWDLPARVVIATVFVLAITTFASLLGPQLSGLLVPFPVFTLVLVAFTHHQSGAATAVRMLRNVVLGTLASGAFFVVTGSQLTTLGPVLTYFLSAIAAMAVSGVVLLASRRSSMDLRIRKSEVNA